MPGDAYDVIKRFWRVQDDGDHAKLSVLFADDADGTVTYDRDDMNG